MASAPDSYAPPGQLIHKQTNRLNTPPFHGLRCAPPVATALRPLLHEGLAAELLGKELVDL